MLYEFVVLALLAQRAAHGYWIAKVVNDAMGPYTRVSNGRLYPLLGRMERDGLIRADARRGPGGRGVKTYALTDLGRARLQELMRDTTSSPGDYPRIFLLKAAVFDLVEREERLRLIDHYRHYCQVNLRHIEGEIDGLAAAAPAPGPVQTERMTEVMRHRLRQWRLELSWTEELRRAELAS